MPKKYRSRNTPSSFLVFIMMILVLCSSCDNTETDRLQQALESDHPAIQAVMQKPQEYEVQIIFTEIKTTSDGSVQFNDHTYQLNNELYFYPASTVKLPAAILALEQLQNFPEIDIHTPYSIARDSLEHTINDDIRQIFAVSDNEAYNRLYEFMGRDFINQKLREKGIAPVQISHRLSTSDAANNEHQPLRFISNLDSLHISGTTSMPISPLTMAGVQKGKGYIQGDSLVSRPMDFSEKNYFPLLTQHELMKRLFFETEYNKKERFHLSEENKKLLLHHMHALPRNNGYDEATYYDGYGKFFIYGDTQERIPDHIKIYNKVGYAYGTLTETAYIHDTLNNIQFLLTATILVNKNGIFNDDTYEFDTIGIPFLAQLGRELYQQQSK